MKKFSEIADKLKAYVDNMTKGNSALFKIIGDEAVKRIKTRTRLGQGCKEWGNYPNPLPGLKASTKSARGRMNLSGMTSPGKSNLTMTGHMLDSLAYKVSDNKTTIYFDNDFAENKREWAEDGDVGRRVARQFFNLTISEINGLKKIIVSYFNKIRKTF
jgi:hypothetical protein